MNDHIRELKAKAALLHLLGRPIDIGINMMAKVGLFMKWTKIWLSYSSHDNDIYIATYPRSGTTVMQMIMYQLVSDGSMNFTHISEKIPYFERAFLCRTIPDENGARHPKIFKTHLRRSHMYWWPGKYIHIYRSSDQVLISCFRFYCSHLGYRGTLDEFFTKFLKGDIHSGSWFSYVAGWRKCKGDPNILFLTYDDITANLPNTLPKIADFCGIALTEDLRKRVLERSAFGFMKQNEDKFDHITEIMWEKGMMRGEFIREGRVSSPNWHLSREQLQLLSLAEENEQISERLTLDESSSVRRKG